MKYKGFVSGLAVGIGIATAASHALQVESITREAAQVAQEVKTSQKSTKEDIRDVLSIANHTLQTGKDDYEFLFGDFSVVDGKSRCGGVAKTVIELGAERGFTGDIQLERQGYGLHYAAVLSREGNRYEIIGSPPSLSYRQLEP